MHFCSVASHVLSFKCDPIIESVGQILESGIWDLNIGRRFVQAFSLVREKKQNLPNVSIYELKYDQKQN